MRDATGQMYMRNRYYDPQSARFTQEDPIGIAGGLNVYGFAGGDPVSYSDPYGLTCLPCITTNLTVLRFVDAYAKMEVKGFRAGADPAHRGIDDPDAGSFELCSGS
jgi:uncharacterized protein RhaS with RHS repeats